MRRRVLPALLALTVLVLLADLAGAPLGPVRGIGDAVLGPVERLVAPRADETDRVRADNVRLAEEVRRLRDRERTSDQVAELDTGELPSVTARVVALDRAGTSGPCLLYTSPSPRDRTRSRMPSSA